MHYGFCTNIAASNDCSWTSNCLVGRVICTSSPFSTTHLGELGMLSYVPENSDTTPFAGITRQFVNYFENVSTVFIRDTHLNPPVRWNLNTGFASFKKVNTLVVYSQPGGLYGTLPQRFTTQEQLTLSINGSVEGTLPASWLDNTNILTLKITNHRLVGTIPAAYLSHYFLSFDISSTEGRLVGDFPDSPTCQLSTAFTVGEDNNGGLFCKCGTSCTANTATGVNACYNYQDTSATVDGCATVDPIPNCVNTKLTMRYGTLCYDVCESGCAAGSVCGVVVTSGVPAFECVTLTVETVTTPSSYSSTSDSTVYFVSAIVLLLLL